MEINIDSQSALEALPILFGIMFGICIICWIILSVQKKKNEGQPVRQEHVVVMEKPPIPANSIIIIQNLTFQLDNGERICIAVPTKEQLVVGDKGILTWQGTAFRSFVRDSRE